ncbi:MAG: hypothetical protein LUF86_05575 [Clostridiales bacterium]|nr:hypothetical protein [Clostridiales bacterium]
MQGTQQQVRQAEAIRRRMREVLRWAQANQEALPDSPERTANLRWVARRLAALEQVDSAQDLIALFGNVRFHCGTRNAFRGMHYVYVAAIPHSEGQRKLLCREE